MKVDFVISALSGGGAERVMAILANGLSEKKHNIGLITFNQGDAFVISKNVRRIKLHKSGKSRFERIRRFIRLLGYYRKKNNRPDVIVSFITQLSLIAIVIAKIYRIPIIASEHNSHLQSQRPHFLTKFTRDFVYPRANYITVLTAFDIDFYQKNKCNVLVMPNPCSFMPVDEVNTNKDKVILAVGSLDRYNHKGFDNLIDICCEVLESRPDWILKIVGGGKNGLKFLQEKVSEKGIENQVIFTGFVSNVAEIMKESEIYILSSRFEGLPMVLLEAMSQGMACIAYDCKTGPSDIIQNEVDGILIEDQNKEMMVRELGRLMDDKQLRLKLGRKAVANLDRFSLENILLKWEGLFEEIQGQN